MLYTGKHTRLIVLFVINLSKQSIYVKNSKLNLKGLRNEGGVAFVRCHPSIRLHGMIKIMKNFNRYCRCPDGDLNLPPPEYRE